MSQHLAVINTSEHCLREPAPTDAVRYIRTTQGLRALFGVWDCQALPSHEFRQISLLKSNLDTAEAVLSTLNKSAKSRHSQQRRLPTSGMAGETRPGLWVLHRSPNWVLTAGCAACLPRLSLGCRGSMSCGVWLLTCRSLCHDLAYGCCSQVFEQHVASDLLDARLLASSYSEATHLLVHCHCAVWVVCKQSLMALCAGGST